MVDVGITIIVVVVVVVITSSLSYYCLSFGFDWKLKILSSPF
jgi:hypothetical protein